MSTIICLSPSSWQSSAVKPSDDHSPAPATVSRSNPKRAELSLPTESAEKKKLIFQATHFTEEFFTQQYITRTPHVLEFYYLFIRYSMLKEPIVIVKISTIYEYLSTTILVIKMRYQTRGPQTTMQASNLPSFV